MDSMVVGEGEILSQVRAALDAAHAAGSLGPVLRRLGSAAVGAGRRVRAGTGISRNPLSVVTLALHAAAADENRARRMREVEQAEALVAAEVERFMELWRSRQVVPTIAALRA